MNSQRSKGSVLLTESIQTERYCGVVWLSRLRLSARSLSEFVTARCLRCAPADLTAILGIGGCPPIARTKQTSRW